MLASNLRSTELNVIFLAGRSPLCHWRHVIFATDLASNYCDQFWNFCMIVSNFKPQLPNVENLKHGPHCDQLIWFKFEVDEYVALVDSNKTDPFLVKNTVKSSSAIWWIMALLSNKININSFFWPGHHCRIKSKFVNYRFYATFFNTWKTLTTRLAMQNKFTI